VTEEELLAWSRTRIAGYKRPKSVAFIPEEEMPRTATGKILHRVLRQRYGTAQPRQDISSDESPSH
jgi:fatty-acyl-CoA synthase